ncbi:MAG: hypothetical protein K2L31_04060 [Muribaculum sp.]|nr:hypothetical protein [Muribaculum sp.]
MKEYLKKVRQWLSALSFKTGVAVAAICVVCYILSFLQMFLPVSVAVKGALWVIFFGLAKACQYTALIILGKAGIERIRHMLRSR